MRRSDELSAVTAETIAMAILISAGICMIINDPFTDIL
jgi:hypothetical protein